PTAATNRPPSGRKLVAPPPASPASDHQAICFFALWLRKPSDAASTHSVAKKAVHISVNIVATKIARNGQVAARAKAMSKARRRFANSQAAGVHASASHATSQQVSVSTTA